MNLGGLDIGELLKRAVKYIVEGLMVALAAFAIPKRNLQLDEIRLMIYLIVNVRLNDV